MFAESFTYILSLMFILWSLPFSAPDEGKLWVNTQPRGAIFSYRLVGSDTWSNGGATPKTLKLPVGKYELKVKRKDFLDEVRIVEVNKGKTSAIDLKLKNQFGESSEFLIDRKFVPSAWPLSEARRSYAERERYNLENSQKREFFYGVKALLNGNMEPNPVSVLRGNGDGERIELGDTVAIPGDVIVVDENGRRFAMVYAGEFTSSSRSNSLSSYFYYPYKFKSGMQLNTYPPRWVRETLYDVGLLEPAETEKAGDFSQGLSHSRAEFEPLMIDRFQLEFLNAPMVGNSLYLQVADYSYEVWRLSSKFGNPLEDMSTIQSPGESGWLGGIVGKYRKKHTQEHLGWDLYATEGTRVKAVAAGTLKYHEQRNSAGKLDGFGRYLILIPESESDYAFIYAHLNEATSAIFCQKGDAIGTVGSTGNADPKRPHLHFEIRSGAAGKPELPLKSGVIDPADYYPFPEYYVEGLNTQRKPIVLPGFLK